jgi:3-phosphoinositide dependent protein kinase-1
VGSLLGSGSYSEVKEVTSIKDKKVYALKILSKALLMREKKMRYARVERDVMLKVVHENILKLRMTFQDRENLYFVVDLARNGDLQSLLSKMYAFTQESAAPLLAQVLTGLSAVHSHNIIHRDLKPGNILLDSLNCVKLSDFGSAKICEHPDETHLSRASVVGTPNHVAPEVLTGSPQTFSCDLWSFGSVIYHLLVGEPPFESPSAYLTFGKIKAGRYSIPDFVSAEAKDLIQRLLVQDPEKRLGAGEEKDGYPSIRQHPFFNGIDWARISSHPIQAIESSPQACEIRDARKRAQQEIEKEKRLSKEQRVWTEEVVWLAPGDDKKATLVLTDTPRLLLLVDGCVVTEIPLVDELTTTVNGNVLVFEINPVFTCRVRSDDAGNCKHVIDQVFSDM